MSDAPVSSARRIPPWIGMWAIKPRSTPPSAFARFLGTMCAVLVALIIGGAFFALSGHPPFTFYAIMAQGVAGDAYALSETLVKAIPLALAGLGVTIAFRAGLWNIGAEGQIYMGAIGATAVPLFLPRLPPIVMLPLMAAAGGIAGSIWALLVALPRIYRNVSEIISSLMLNYVAILFSDYLIYGPWKDPQSYNFPLTPLYPPAARLPTLLGTRLHMGVIIALLAAALLAMLMQRGRWGFELRLVGDSPAAARYAGINLGRSILTAMLISGALAGLAGMTEVSGILHRLQRELSPGYGYSAIIVAWLGRLNAWGVLGMAIFIGAIYVGGYSLQTAGLASSSVLMLQGGILFMVLATDVVLTYRLVPRSGEA